MITARSLELRPPRWYIEETKHLILKNNGWGKKKREYSNPRCTGSVKKLIRYETYKGFVIDLYINPFLAMQSLLGDKVNWRIRDNYSIEVVPIDFNTKPRRRHITISPKDSTLLKVRRERINAIPLKYEVMEEGGLIIFVNELIQEL